MHEQGPPCTAQQNKTPSAGVSTVLTGSKIPHKVRVLDMTRACTEGTIQSAWCSALTGRDRTAPGVHLVLVIKLDADALAVAGGDAATPAAAQRDRHHAVDVGQHDGHTDACGGREGREHTHTHTHTSTPAEATVLPDRFNFFNVLQ